MSTVSTHIALLPQFPLSDYQGDTEKHLRATLSLDEFRAHLVNQTHNTHGTCVLGSYPKLGATGTRGVHKKKHRRGVVKAFEARYTRSLKQVEPPLTQ